MESLDDIQLDFTGGALFGLNVLLAALMFAVALEIRPSDFVRIARDPRGAIVGLLSQFLLLPAATTGLVFVIDPPPSVAVGMILVSTCPGGNVSNFMTYLARGNTALSVGMSATSSLAAVVLTPLNFALWASIHPGAASILSEVAVDTSALWLRVLLVIAVPVTLGMWVGGRLPSLAHRIDRPLRGICVAVFLGFVGFAFASNAEHLSMAVLPLFGVVVLHNASALALGYGAARAVSLREADARAVSIEVGIQNSGLALVIIFDFFGGLGGMALTAALWGIWHLVAGLSLALFWSTRATEPEPL